MRPVPTSLAALAVAMIVSAGIAKAAEPVEFVQSAEPVKSGHSIQSAEPVDAVESADPAEPTQPGRTHTVQLGETLWQIAARTVGDPTLWPALYLANRDQIKDPSRVYPGQQLAIPEIDPKRVEDLRREGGALNTQ